MVINGLGFANYTLYLIAEFFADKPVERLIGTGVTAEGLNQNLFSRCLDLIYKFDVTPFFMRLSTHMVKQLELPCSGSHIDSTSFHVDGMENITVIRNRKKAWLTGVDALRDYCVQQTENEFKNGQYA